MNCGPEQAALDITAEFHHRPWHKNVRCNWDGRALQLEADNDYDEKGLALLDEFSDVIIACVQDAAYSDMQIISVTSYRDFLR